MGKSEEKARLHEEETNKERSLWQEAWRRFKKNRMAMAGLYFILFLVLTSVVTAVVDLATHKEFYNHYVIRQSLRYRLQKPSLTHPFGLDEFGRDMLLRMLWGTRYSLFMGTLAILFSSLIGGALGAVAEYYGKRLDNALMRFMDILLAIPSMLLAIAIVAALGTSLTNVLIAIGVWLTSPFSRERCGLPC